jgi:ligand-binding SRPBCC domain-containing protein
MLLRRFIKQSEIPARVEAVFAFHEHPRAFEMLLPPWQKVELIEASGSLKVGSRLVIKLRFGPLSTTWVAEHTEYIPNRLFEDVQCEGPFSRWRHRHLFEPTARGTTIYTDDIEYALPLGWIADAAAGWFVRRQLARLFDYRHNVVAQKVNSEK